ncbi:LuxR family transcriptional regulator [Streptomyces sp. NPDC048416]|uniref:helix-turn-helix transcriptional regulator n=1 Tax=Streptomyces sp. NPDC048416 TaxID=3365546 RepID=UPI00371F8D17
MASGPRHKGGLTERADAGRGAAGIGLDALEGALLKAHGLIEWGVSTQHGALTRSPAQPPPPDDTVADPHAHAGADPDPDPDSDADERVGRLVDLAQWSVGMVLPSDGRQVPAMCAALEALGDRRRRGLAIRLLCTAGPPDDEVLRALADSRMASFARVATTRAREAVIVDGRVAYFPADASGTGRTTVRTPAVVRVLESMFAGAWDTAVPLADYDRLRHRAHSETVRSVLSHLGAGLTDDAGAREMRVSLRTYRRHVAELMRALGASTRFEAGARAVELGLMPCHG